MNKLKKISVALTLALVVAIVGVQISPSGAFAATKEKYKQPKRE